MLQVVAPEIRSGNVARSWPPPHMGVQTLLRNFSIQWDVFGFTWSADEIAEGREGVGYSVHVLDPSEWKTAVSVDQGGEWDDSMVASMVVIEGSLQMDTTLPTWEYAATDLIYYSDSWGTAEKPLPPPSAFHTLFPSVPVRVLFDGRDRIPVTLTLQLDGEGRVCLFYWDFSAITKENAKANAKDKRAAGARTQQQVQANSFSTHAHALADA